MKNGFIKCTLSAMALLLSTALVQAADVTVSVPDVKGAAKTSVDATKAGAKAAADKTKAGAKATADKTKAGAKAATDKTKATAGAATDKTRATVDASKNKAKAATTGATAAIQPKIIDINNATAAELKAIPGVGDNYAAKIVAGRPYANKAQLKTRNILPAPLYEKVKDQIVAKQAVKK